MSPIAPLTVSLAHGVVEDLLSQVARTAVLAHRFGLKECAQLAGEAVRFAREAS